MMAQAVSRLVERSPDLIGAYGPLRLGRDLRAYCDLQFRSLLRPAGTDGGDGTDFDERDENERFA
jgi:hypothetical protein